LHLACPVRLKRRIDMDEAAPDMDEAAPDIDEAAPDMDKAAPPLSQRSGGAVLPGPLDFRPGPWLGGTADVADDVVALALASAKVYTFISIDYPGAAQSEIWDHHGFGAVGMFVFDPGADGAIGTGDADPGAANPIGTGDADPGGADANPASPGGADANPGDESAIGTGDADPGGAVAVNPADAGGGTSLSLPPSPKTAFMFTFDFVYRILTVPNSIESFATGIDGTGRIVGWYVGLDGVRRGFVKDGDTFHDRAFGSATQVLGVSDDGGIVGSYVDDAGREHGFVGDGPIVQIDFPSAAHLK
jgi:hypothetical protein